jgi:hypothetical protein
VQTIIPNCWFEIVFPAYFWQWNLLTKFSYGWYSGILSNTRSSSSHKLSLKSLIIRSYIYKW